MSEAKAFSLTHLLVALAGAAFITWLAASLAPVPRFGAQHLDDAPPAASFAEPDGHAPAGAARPTPRWVVPAPQQAFETPRPAATEKATTPRGRSYKCVSGARVEYSEHPCAEDADSSLVNVTPALVGAVPARR